MNFFNTVVYCDDGKIKIKIEHIRSVDESLPTEMIDVSVKSFLSIHFDQKKEKIQIPSFVDDEIVKTELNRSFFTAEDGFGLKHPKHIEPEKEFYYDTLIYELPSNPNEFLHFVRIMDLFTRYAGLNAALRRNQSIDVSIKNGKLNEAIWNFFSPIGYLADTPIEPLFKGEHRFIYHLLSLQNIPEAYQHSLSILKCIMEHALRQCLYSNGEKRYGDLFNSSLLKLMTAGRNPYDLLDPTVSKTTKRTLITDLYTTFTKAGEKKELAALFTTLNRTALERLFKSCIGMQAEDGGRYHFGYTEWDFLRHAEFTIRADGRMSMIGLQNNDGYKKHYAKGKRNHDKFEIEMRHLAKMLGLEFAEGCDFHQELIFTEVSTQQLKVRGLHYNPLYLEKLDAKEAINQSRNVFFKPDTEAPKKQTSYFSQCTIC